MSRVRNAWRALTKTAPVSGRVSMPRRMGARASDVIDALLGIKDNGVTSLLNNGNYVKLREQARELAKTSPLIARYVTVSVENTWGPNGITLQAMPARTRGDDPNKPQAKKNEEVFYRWAATCDVSGGSLDTIMHWFVERYRVDGEAGIEIVYDSSLFLGIGLRRVDADLIDWTYNQTRRSNAPAIVHGVELDRYNKPVAYHILSHTRKDVEFYGQVTRRRVPASRVLIQKHGDAVRGATPIAPVIVRSDMINAMQEALVAVHRASACKMGFLEQTLMDGESLESADGSSRISMDASSGVIEQLPPGMKFTSWDPTAPGAQYEPMYKTLVQEIAAPLGCTYVSLTGDLSEANYSSMRQGELSAREGYRVHHGLIAALILQPIYVAVIRNARIAGEIVSMLDLDLLTQSVWHGRVWPWVDPVKDAAAIRELLALGLTTRTRELNTLGLAAADVFAELSSEIAAMKALNIPTEVTSIQASVATAQAPSSPRLAA